MPPLAEVEISIIEVNGGGSPISDRSNVVKWQTYNTHQRPEVRASVGGGGVILQWEAVPGAVAYAVNSGPLATAFVAQISETSYTLPANAEGVYSVSAYFTDGQYSAASNPVVLSGGAVVAPAAPTHLGVKVVGQQARLYWDNVPGNEEG